ncbi:hypothetical protein BX661DRAFT_196461 [Kickxella alabastrina]|uniref:uncharacterized protein n=1 Tax=Kickxella alabastrina TaxID=61397 RepID=UPI00221FBDAB|nr:uncharacterized protein BX661DRAFT_196461 [Kickxella alabastrina]KAI7833234.1 hypothetical protein BX661DRAFT_196461 [Kickxella alabastrina]
MSEATLDEAESAISELTTEYENQYTDAENAAFRIEMDALYVQLNESHRETSEIRCNTSARLEKSGTFRAQEEAGGIAAGSACASTGVAVANLEPALSAANAAHNESMATLAEAKHNAEREAEAARSEALELHAKLADTSCTASQLEAKNSIAQQKLTDLNKQLDNTKQQNKLLQDQVQELQRGAKKHVLDLDEMHSKLLCLRKTVAKYRVAAAGGHMCIYCVATLGNTIASELARH